MREGDSMEKSEERNKIISELQTVIKEQVELKEIEIPGTITPNTAITKLIPLINHFIFFAA